MMPFEKLPPHDIEAEEAIVAALLVDPDVPAKVAGLVEPHDFFREKNGWVYDAAMALWSRGEDANQITVAHELAQRGLLEETGGQTYLSDIIRRLPTSLGAEFYAGIVKREATYRSLASVGTAITQMAYEAPPEVDKVMARAEEMLLGLRKTRVRPHTRTAAAAIFGDALDGKGGLLETLEVWLEDPSKIRGLPTGWDWLDRALDGWLPTWLVIVMADTSVGKSLFVHWQAWWLGKQGYRVVIVSTEMSTAEVMERIIMMEARVDPLAVRLRGFATAEEKQRVNMAMPVVADWPITVLDLGGVSWPQVQAEVRRIDKGDGIDWLALDHIQQITVPGLRAEEPAALTEIVNGAKQLAMNYGIPVVAVSHVNRESAKGGQGIGVHSGKGSATIEQGPNAQVILEPVTWRRDDKSGRHRWFLATEEEVARAKQHDLMDVRYKLSKQRRGGAPSAVRWVNWKEGGRFVATPRGVQE